MKNDPNRNRDRASEWYYANRQRVLARARRRYWAAKGKTVPKSRVSPKGRRLKDEVGYDGAHDRARVFHAGSPCSRCGQGFVGPGGNVDCALIHGRGVKVERRMVQGHMRDVRYSSNPRDYRPLCVWCHAKYDKLGKHERPTRRGRPIAR